MNSIYNNFVEAIGNTPLIRLNGPSKETGCNIFGKAEFLNPGGSVKDRAALAIIKEAEEKNLIKRNRCPHDRRQVLCCITDQALILLDRLEKPVDIMDKTILVGLDHDQLSTLLILLQRIRKSASL